jgi:hypothetical protein
MPLTREEREALEAAGYSLMQIALIDYYNLVSPIHFGEEEMKEWWETYRAIVKSP